jgi:hypothetical protein
MEVSDLLNELELHPPTDLSPVRRRHRDKAITLIREESLLHPAHSFNTVRLHGIDDDGQLCVGGEILQAPAQLPKQGELAALGCGVCTLGPRLDVRIRLLIAEKRAALALALDYLGNELLIALSRRLEDLIQANVHSLGLSMGQELMIEDSESDLSTHAAILRLAGAAEIGITLHRSNLLLPLKSTAVAFTVGRNLQQESRHHCKQCTLRKGCTLDNWSIPAIVPTVCPSLG